MRRIKLASIVLAFAAPAAAMTLALLAATSMASSGPVAMPWRLAVLLQAPGVLADRWYFFAQARHPQNLYYQFVS